MKALKRKQLIFIGCFISFAFLMQQIISTSSKVEDLDYWKKVSGSYLGEVISLEKIWDDRYWYILVLEGGNSDTTCYKPSIGFSLVSNGERTIFIVNKVEKADITLGDSIYISVKKWC